MNLKNSKMPIKHLITIVILLVLFIITMIHGGINSLSDHVSNVTRDNQTEKASSVDKYNNYPTQGQADQVVSTLQNKIKGGFEYNGHGAYIVNNNKPTIKAKKNTQEYAANTIDKQGRPQVANAFLTHHSRQYKNREETHNGRSNWVPLGWHQMTGLPGTYTVAYNRGHLLGYALVGNIKSFDASESNKKNIVSQTAWANQADSKTNTGQNYYEGLVRKALDQNKKVRYQVKPWYEGNELVPRATQIQAISTDGKLKFNVLVPNIQGNINVSYDTGNVTQATIN